MPKLLRKLVIKTSKTIVNNLGNSGENMGSTLRDLRAKNGVVEHLSVHPISVPQEVILCPQKA